ncbi:hypothetical protein ASE28_26060 [Acidovorax sp. Root219]|nr:hypothetical protein ASE28_26060 [Acidovorax sp. Root219]
MPGGEEGGQAGSHGPQPLNGRQAKLLWRIYPFTDKGLAVGKLNALGDSKSHESGGSRRYGITRPPHAVSGGSTGSTSCWSSAIVRLCRFLNASIGITVAAAVALCNELALSGCRIVRLRRLQATQQLPRLVHLIEPDEHAALVQQHAVHAALAQALLQLCGVAFDHQRAVALHLHDAASP